MIKEKQIVNRILDALVDRYGSETFIADGYAYHEDAQDLFMIAMGSPQNIEEILKEYEEETKEKKSGIVRFIKIQLKRENYDQIHQR